LLGEENADVVLPGEKRKGKGSGTKGGLPDRKKTELVDIRGGAFYPEKRFAV